MTSAVYAARMLGGSLVVAALGLLDGGPQGEAVERFSALALLALTGIVAASLLAPRVLRLEGAPEPAAAA